MENRNQLAVKRSALLTHREITEDLVLSAEDAYEQAIDKNLLETMTLDEALGEVPVEISGAVFDDVLPATVAAQESTGIFPPATQAELQYLQLENKNAGRAECLKKMLASGSLTLADTKGFRTRTAYRLIRAMARIRGILEGFDMLQVAMNLAPDDNLISMWYMPVPLIPSAFLTGNRLIRSNLNQVDHCGASYTFHTPNGLIRLKGSTTLPPPIPDHFYSSDPAQNWKERLSRKIPKGYDPRNDEPLILFCENMTILAEQLNVPRGAPEEPWAGEYGLAGLLNPHTARLTWPTRDELVMYEEEYLLKVFDKAAHTSVQGTERWLQQFFGLGRLEALDITKTAIRVGSDLYNEGTEEMRNLELKRIDIVGDMCDLANDPRARIAATRLKWQALGLTQREEGEAAAMNREAAIAGLRSVEDEIEEE